MEGYLREEGHLSPNDYKFYFFDGSCTCLLYTSIVCALLIGVYSFMFMPDTYTATTSMYVLTNQELSLIHI